MKMYDNYSPLDLIRKPFSSPIFNYEIKRLGWTPEFEDIRRADWLHLWQIIQILFVIAVGLAAITSASYVVGTVLSVAILVLVTIVPFIYTVIVDLRTVATTITFWHDHSQAGKLDLMRLAVPTDTDLLTILRAAAELTVWRGMRWEMALRGYLVFCSVALSSAVGGFLFLYLVLTRSDDSGYWESLLALLFVGWLVRLLLMHLREPLWRMRTLVAISIAIANLSPDTNTSILVASAAALFLKLVLLVGVVLLSIFNLSAVQTHVEQRPQYLLTVLWLIGSALLTTRLVRAAHGMMHTICTWLTLHTLQEADTLLSSTLSLYNEKA